jgi:4-oxalocrotonate tautomerase
VNDFIQLFGYGEESVSVAITEVDPDEWKEKVYQQEILEKEETIYKQPGYRM